MLARHQIITSIILLCSWLGGSFVALAHDDSHTALQLVNHQLNDHPNDAQLHVRKAAILLENGQPAYALRAVARARVLGDSSLALSLIEAQSLLALNRPQESLTTISTFPNSVPVLTLRARAFHASGESSAAVAQCRAVLTIEPDPDIAFLAADILAGSGDIDAAIHLLDDFFPSQSRPYSIELRALDYEISLKSWDAALARISHKIHSSPRPEPWMSRRAEILTMATRNAEAKTAWDELLTTIRDLPPNTRSSHAMLQLAQKARNSSESLSPLSR